MESPTIVLNVRGFRFEIERRLLDENPNGKLARVCHDMADASQPLYFNRDPFIFNSVVDFYSTGRMHLPPTCASKISDELRFWEINVEALCLCCGRKYGEELDDLNGLQALLQSWSGFCSKNGTVEGSTKARWREVLWEFMEGSRLTKGAKIYSAFISLAGLLSVLSISIATLPEMRTVLPRNATPGNISLTEQYKNVLSMLNGTLMSDVLYAIDCVMIVILGVDLIVRFLAYESKREFFTSFINAIGIVSVVPAAFGYLVLGLTTYFQIDLTWNTDIYLYVIFVLESSRVIYLLRIARFYTPLKIILLSLKDSRTELFLLSVVVLIGATLFGYLVYAVEMYRGNFWSIPEAIWWAVITMTTVGYGDVVPVTGVGKVIGSVCALTGILLLAIPVPIVSSNFLKYYKVSKIRKLLVEGGYSSKTSAVDGAKAIENGDAAESGV